MVSAFVGLGSNLGDSSKTLVAAASALDRLPETALLACSSFYRSRPMTMPPETRRRRYVPPGWHTRQPDYLNAVALIETALPAMRLLRQLQAVEKRLGRLRTGLRWASRPLDLDLLLYGGRRINLPRLVVPHPGIAERLFVLRPLADIAPLDMVIPGHDSLGRMLTRLNNDSIERVD